MAETTGRDTLLARKPHRCSWCGQAILASDRYRRWRQFEDGEAFTVKMHLECDEAMGDLNPADGWYPGEMKRGSLEER